MDINRRRVALQSRLTRHLAQAPHVDPTGPLDKIQPHSPTAEHIAKNSNPEHASLSLPSCTQDIWTPSTPLNESRPVTLERELRRSLCLWALQQVRTTSQQQALLFQKKQKNVRGEVQNTRVQSMVARLSNRVDLAVWEYRNARAALWRLGPTEEDQSRLKPLLKEDLSGLLSLLQGERTLGEGQKRLPWFWTVRSMTVGQHDNSEGENDEGMSSILDWFCS